MLKVGTRKHIVFLLNRASNTIARPLGQVGEGGDSSGGGVNAGRLGWCDGVGQIEGGADFDLHVCRWSTVGALSKQRVDLNTGIINRFLSIACPRFFFSAQEDEHWGVMLQRRSKTMVNYCKRRLNIATVPQQHTPSNHQYRVHL